MIYRLYVIALYISDVNVLYMYNIYVSLISHIYHIYIRIYFH